MTYEIYRYIFLGGAILTGIMVVVTVLVFFFLKIPTVMGDLTGANARKAIAKIRNQNERSGDKTYQTSAVNKERGKLTEKISQSGRLIPNESVSMFGAMETEKIGTQQLEYQENAGETTLLAHEECMNETSVLAVQDCSAQFVIEYEITYIHTDEVII